MCEKNGMCAAGHRHLQWGAWTDAGRGLAAVGGDDPLFGRTTGNSAANGPRMQVVEGATMMRLGEGRSSRILDDRTWEAFPDLAVARRSL